MLSRKADESLRGWKARTARALLAVLALAACGESGPPEERRSEDSLQFARVSDDRVAHGERISRVLGCNGCHGENLTGEDWSEPGFGTLWTANLSRAAASYSDAQLAQMITTGRRPDGRELWEMPSHLFTALSAEDMRALIAYIRSIPPAGEAHPPPGFEAGARREIAAGRFKSSATQVREEGRSWPPEAGGQHALGRYIVRATCAECHGMNLEGGQPNPEATPRPDLRMVAAYEPADFHRLLRTGKAAGNREVSLMSEVSRGRYRHLTDAEVEAIYRYLQAVGRDDPGS